MFFLHFSLFLYGKYDSFYIIGTKKRGDSPIIIDDDMLSYLNKYDTNCSPFDVAKYKDEVSLTTIREEYENGKDATFALYTDGDKYKNILETVNFPLYVGK